MTASGVRRTRELLKIQERKLRVRDTMAIERGDDTVATLRKAMSTPLRERFKVQLAGGGEYDLLAPAAAVAIDQMTHDRSA